MRKLGKFWPIFLAPAALLLVLAVACEGEEEEGTPTADGMGVPATATATVPATPTATVPVTPTATVLATPTATRTPVVEGPGITDTEIILGADCPLTGATAAVYATIPQTMNAYFKYVNETQGGVCGRRIVY